MKFVCARCHLEGKPALHEVESVAGTAETPLFCSLHQDRLTGRPAMQEPERPPGDYVASASLHLRELEAERRHIGAWVAGGQLLLQQVFPRLLQESERMILRAELTAQRCEALRHEVLLLRHEVAALEAEQRALAESRSEMLTLLQQVTADTRHLVVEPLDQMLARMETGIAIDAPRADRRG